MVDRRPDPDIGAKRNEHPTKRSKRIEESAQFTLSDDLLKGADAIAEFMFGDREKRRQVYHLAQNVRPPVFKLGATLCARKSRLLDWIEKQEAGASGPRD